MEEKILTLHEFDMQYYDKYPLLCGTDEAGRGPLAGDVFAAAVIFAPDTVIEGINDSKKLTAKKRDALYDEIKEKALYWSIQRATVEEIEELNILNCAMLAMKRSVESLGVTPDLVIADGNKTPPVSCPVQFLVKGDAKSQSVAAASILAKVERDRYMEAMAEKYPQYDFGKHKGYGTKLHYQRLDEFGPSEIHRMSFLKKYYAKKQNDS
ncbi:MAG: ribonuclease HII [Ruminococcus sp.]|nr:ribonuclease HII [Ruminococcus sp.]MCR5142155.1 ribonuclease HII [Ruminococcus sp.]